MAKKIQFINKNGETLAARLELPDSDPKAFALFAHCFTCNKNLSAVRNIGKALNGKGIAVLRFDFTGLGESEGDFENTNFSSNIEDLVCAANFLEKEYKAPSILIGHSLGGAAALFAADKITSINAVATLGAPHDPEHVAHLLKSKLNEIEQNGIAELTIGGRVFTVKKQFLQDIQSRNMNTLLKSLKKPILVMHSPQDNTVSIENAAKIYSAAWHPKNFISLDGADHLLSQSKDSYYAGEIIATWFSRYAFG